MSPSSDALKRKLRHFRRQEMRIRFGEADPPPGSQLVWESFFAIKDQRQVRYPFTHLLQMSPDEFFRAAEEYFYFVYYQSYREQGLQPGGVFDPLLLSYLGLAPSAGQDEIKNRFRELAKRYHPDVGGDNEKFIELMSVYTRLTERKS